MPYNFKLKRCPSTGKTILTKISKWPRLLTRGLSGRLMAMKRDSQPQSTPTKTDKSTQTSTKRSLSLTPTSRSARSQITSGHRLKTGNKLSWIVGCRGIGRSTCFTVPSTLPLHRSTQSIWRASRLSLLASINSATRGCRRAISSFSCPTCTKIIET